MRIHSYSDLSAGQNVLVAALSTSLLAVSCSPGSGARTTGNGGADGAAGSAGYNPSTGGQGSLFNAGSDASTVGQQGQQVECGALPKTTVTAKVYDPAGKNPLYSVVVYVPSTTVLPIQSGVVCETCATPVSGTPIAAGITDPTGKFTMENVPVGTNIPVVLQIGKWRRQITIPEVKPCQDNVFDDPNLWRLPRNQTEGNIPHIAIAAGDADRLQCIFRRIGVDASEFTNPGGGGAINIYNQPADPDQGGGYDNGAAYPPAVPMWEDLSQMMQYDIVMLACAGVNSATNPFKDTNYISANAKNVMVQYVNGGGRVLAEHYHWSWIRTFNDSSGDLPPIASPFGEVASWVEPISTSAIGTTINTLIDTSTPKGQDMAAWLLAVNASTTLGALTLTGEVKPTALDVTPPNPAVSQRWIYEPGTGSAALRTHYFSFNTPIGVDPKQQCGRFVYTGLHVTTSDTGKADSKTKFPSCCQNRDLLPQEKAIEFMVFDLSSCVDPPGERQKVPVIVN